MASAYGGDEASQGSGSHARWESLSTSHRPSRPRRGTAEKRDAVGNIYPHRNSSAFLHATFTANLAAVKQPVHTRGYKKMSRFPSIPGHVIWYDLNPLLLDQN
jgi:hypothetical protein